MWKELLLLRWPTVQTSRFLVALNFSEVISKKKFEGQLAVEHLRLLP